MTAAKRSQKEPRIVRSHSKKGVTESVGPDGTIEAGQRLQELTPQIVLVPQKGAGSSEIGCKVWSSL